VKPRSIVLWASILALGCQTPLPPREPLDPIDPRPAALITALEQTAAARSSLQGALHLSLDAPDLHFRRPQRLALRRPADLRVEILGLFGQIAAVLVTDGTTYQTFDASRGSIESGDVTPDLLWRIARVALQPREAVDLLLGAPRPSAEAFFAGAYSEPGGGVSLEFRDEQGRLRERFGFDVEGQLRDFIRFAHNGAVAWRASFNDYRDVSGSPFAFELRLNFPELDARASLKFDHAALDPELGDELFALRMR
jgi:hypothetical protein